MEQSCTLRLTPQEAAALIITVNTALQEGSISEVYEDLVLRVYMRLLDMHVQDSLKPRKESTDAPTT